MDARSIPHDPDALHDAFLDAFLGGATETPQAFLARHGVEDVALLARLASVVRLGAEGREQRRAVPTRLPGRIGPYRILSRLGEGGMGTVYVAEQESLGRRVALKVIRAELASSPVHRRRFEREARAVARLRHPNVVSVHEMGEADGALYIAMELVPGRPLSEILREGVPPLARTLAWTTALAHALAYAHEQGIVHRDVKPANVIVGPDDRPVLLDFGIAHWMGPEASRLTQSFAGSPPYAAPEQIAGEDGDVDGRTDVYALGVTLYECLTGRLPFEGGAIAKLFQRILAEDPPPPRSLNPDVTPSCQAVVLKALEKQPAARYATAAAMAEDLEALAARHPVRARRPGPVRRLGRWARRRPARATAVAAAVVTLASAAGVFAWRTAEEARGRRLEARASLASAARGVDAFRALRAEIHADQVRFTTMSAQREAQHYPVEEERAYQRLSRELVGRRRARESLFHETMESLARAERLDPELSGDELRARLHLERVEEARAAGDASAIGFHEAMARRHDPSGRVTGALRARGRLSVAAEVPGSEVFVFRYVEQAEIVPDGERRLVPVGIHAAEAGGGGGSASVPGTWALRVVRGGGPVREGDVIVTLDGFPVEGTVLVHAEAGPLRKGDRILELDGRAVASLADATWVAGTGPKRARIVRGTETLEVDGLADDIEMRVLWAFAEEEGGRARVVRGDASVEEVVLPPGLTLRPTAAPRFLTHAAQVGLAPVSELELEAGTYACVVRAAGRALAVTAFEVAPGAAIRLDARPPPADAVPDEFVYVWDGIDPTASFYLLEREVRAGEYLEFLNDPETRAEIDAGRAKRFPRNSNDAAEGGTWARGADGRFSIRGQSEWMPAFGVSMEDARAYVAWRTKRDGRRYALPTHPQWLLAGMGRADRKYPWGAFFCPRWTKSCFARPRVQHELVMSYPIDESVCGVYDLAGGVMEWTDDWFDESRRLRSVCGGAWGQAGAGMFRLWSKYGMREGDSHYESGFRLALPVEERRR